jgi:hypothetical protein
LFNSILFHNYPDPDTNSHSFLRPLKVVGSAVSAFAEVCPERWSVLHPCFRKLCHLLADLDEWAQIQLLAILQR